MCYSQCVCVLCCVCFCRSLPCLRCLLLSQGGNSGGSSLQRERDRGRLEFSRVCLQLRPLLNEECSILLIMLLWLMSFSADSGECNKTLLLFGLFASFLIGLNKRALRSSSPAIHIQGSWWHLCACAMVFLFLFFFLCVFVVV